MKRLGRRWPLAVLAVAAIAWLAVSAGWGRWRVAAGEPSELLEDRWHEAHRIVDRNGELLRELPGDHGRRGRPATLEEIGPRLIRATLAAEDDDFYTHDGIDRAAILRAVEQNLRHGRLVSGASTVTQQLVKLLDTRGIPGQRTAEIKLREAARAQNLELTLSKDEILTAYLNRLPYGHGLIGPEAAAQAYFGVRSRDLSWAQCAFLAVLPRAPSYLDPYVHPDRVALRQRALLQALHEAGDLSDDQRLAAQTETIELQPLRHPFAAPHLTQALRAEGRLTAGPVTTTTLDAGLQRDVEGLVRTHMAKLAEHGARDAAVMVVDNATREVLAYVGSTDFHDPEIAGQVDMVRGRRQPGSTLKPFVYALAVASGSTTSDVLADVPTEFIEGAGEVYAPQNFEGGFVGPVSMREALAASLNVPAVRVAARLPDGALLQTLHGLGFASLDRSAEHYGLSLALGSGEVQLRELAAAYAALARGGQFQPLRYTAGDPDSAPVQALEPGVAAAITEALADPLARARLLHGRSPFDIGYPLALKTGTSSGHRDAWTAGFSHERTVAVWVGNANGAAMRELTGAGAAGPLFADVMRRTMLDVRTRGPLWPPDLLVEAEVCPLSGHRPGPACPGTVRRRFVEGAAPEHACSVHVHATERATPSEPYTCDPGADHVVAVLPESLSAWLDRLPAGAPGKDPYGTPWVSVDDARGCNADAPRHPVLRIATPNPGSVVLAGTDQDRVQLRAELRGALRGLAEVEFVVDGEPVARSRFPYQALVALGPGDHDVYARPADRNLGVVVQGTQFSVR